MTLGQRNWLLLLAAVLLAGIPALMALGVLPPLVAEPQWAGGDSIITETVGQIQEGYEPWFSPFFSPGDLGIEPIMFGLQALIGASLIAGFLGYLVGRRAAQVGERGERRTAMIVSVVSLVIAAGLFFVQTELGELQAFLAGLQAVAIGTLGFFVGYPMGQKAAQRTTGRVGGAASRPGLNPFPIDAFAYANRLRWVHPAEKIVFAGLTIAITLISGSPLVALVAMALTAFTVVRLARIAPRAYWHFVRLPLGFILISVLTMAITIVPEAGALWSVPIGAWRIGITAGSLTQAVHVLFVSLACVSASLCLALTTPMVDLADQFRRWHVPVLFVELMTLIYRFIFVLLETAQDMHVAQEARLGYCTPARSLRSVGMLASNLYLRANARAASLFTALTARGYTGDLTVLCDTPAWSQRNLVMIGFAEGLLLALAIFARLEGL